VTDGLYRVRVTDGPLSNQERAYASEMVPLGVRVESGSLVIAAAEALPVATHVPERALENGGTVIPFDAGLYNLEISSINWIESGQFWNESGPDRTHAPSDLVISISARQGHFPGVSGEPHVTGLRQKWLFPDEPRRIGPEVEMVLVTTVRKGPKGLTLKECGPMIYSATLEDYSGVQWKDRIRFVVTWVDHGNRTMTGRLLGRIPT